MSLLEQNTIKKEQVGNTTSQLQLNDGGKGKNSKYNIEEI